MNVKNRHCMVKNCKDKHYSKDRCRRHYQWYKYHLNPERQKEKNKEYYKKTFGSDSKIVRTKKTKQEKNAIIRANRICLWNDNLIYC